MIYKNNEIKHKNVSPDLLTFSFKKANYNNIFFKIFMEYTTNMFNCSWCCVLEDNFISTLANFPTSTLVKTKRKIQIIIIKKRSGVLEYCYYSRTSTSTSISQLQLQFRSGISKFPLQLQLQLQPKFPNFNFNLLL